MEQEYLDNTNTLFVPKEGKTKKNCLEAINSFNSVSMDKMCHNPMHLTNHKSQRQSSSVQTTFIPIAQNQQKLRRSSKQLCQCFYCQNVLQSNTFDYHKSQRQSRSVQTTFIPMFSQKRLKPTKKFLEVVNSFVSFSMVQMCHNPMHLANRKSQRQSSSVQTTSIPFLSQKRVKPTKNCLEAVNSFVSVSMVKCVTFIAFD